MTIVSKSQLKSGDGRSSPSPISNREKIQQRQAEGTAEPTMIVPKKGDQDPEKPVHTQGGVAEKNLRSTASRTAAASPEIAAYRTPQDDFGREDDEYISGYKLFAALFGIVSVFFIVLLDFSIISTAIPYITSDFHRLQDVGWYGGAYQLSSAALQPLTGKLYTYLSAKRTFLLFVAIFEIGSLLCAVSTSSTFFILGRTVAGLGTAGLENGALTLIAGAVPLHKRPLYTGIVFAIGQIGIVVGPLIGGALTQYLTWRWCFYINLPIGALSGLFLFFTHIPDETLKPPFSFALLRSIIPNLDLTGCALFAPATVMFLLALQWGSDDYGWSSPTVLGLFAGSGATAVLFSLWEWRVGDQALIPFHLVKRRIVWTSTIQNSFLFITNFVGANYVPIYFQAVKGVGPSLSGVYTLPSILTQLLSIVISGALVGRLGYYLPFGVLGGAITAVACGLISTWNPNTSTAEWIGYQILFGLRGMGLQTAVISVQHAVTPAQNPVAIAFLVFVQNLLAAIFNIVGNTIFTQTLSREISVLAPSVSLEAALAAGGSAEAVRVLLPPGSPELEGLLLAYSKSVNAVFYLLVAVAVVCFAAAWGMGWVDIRKKASEENEE
ncbi:putative MFS multidrug transporter [Truncatella angustata]|uniref:MFS multidrug transporter n=1 Tax=Truncatella angustata TaxID=152316 RepID=A0A9P8RHY9_9PEZI|nr:putative MFS multidrug transporter [Truncatella angustata]KAH6646197.1 putative MFS multidrug transporter [Truncatella angustata]